MPNPLRPHNKEEHANSLAQYLQNGRIFQLKNVVGSLLRKLLLGWGTELQRTELKLIETSDNHKIANSQADTKSGTTLLLEEWESAVGIPDSCFSRINTSLEQRRLHVLIKLGVVLLTEQDYIDLGKLLGTKVKILHPEEGVTFPLPFPLEFSSSVKENRFTMIIELNKELRQCIFPILFPVCFSASNFSEIICIFKKLSPANVKLIFRFVL